MERLHELILNSEAWLNARILQYAGMRGYTKYAPTFAETCRVAIAGLSRALLKEMERGARGLEIHPEDDYATDPAAAFVTLEAQRHRARGVSISMFLGLFKYYRQTYMDLVGQAGFDADDARWYGLFVNRFFDRAEIAFCTEWNGKNNDGLLGELRGKNRKLTNEKNKYLTIFESLYDPALLLDEDKRIVNLNLGAARLFDETTAPGEMYYAGPESSEAGPLSGVDVLILMPWLDPELTAFFERGADKTVFEKSLRTDAGAVHYQVSLSRMLDESGKFAGVVANLRDITIRKEHEAALIREKETSRKYLDVAGVIMLALDAGGNVTMMNRKGRKILGYEKHEILGLCWFDTCLPADQSDHVRGIFKEIMSGNLENHEYVENPVITKTGEIRTVAWHNALLYDNQGHITGCLSSGDDITDHKRAELALQKSETRLRTIYESTSDAVMLLDENGFFDCNEATLHIFGCVDVQSFCACHPADLSPAAQPCGTDSLILANQRIATAMEAGSNRFEWMHKRADTGQIFPAEVLLSRMILDGRTVLQATVRDITERKTIEQALAESEENLRAITDAAGDAIIMMNERGRVSFWNPAARQIFGYEPGEIMGRGMHEMILPECMREGAEIGFMHFQNTGEGVVLNKTLELEGLRKDGTVFPLELSIARVRTAAGWGAVGIVRDTTDRKETADKLKQLMAELERSNNELEQFDYVASHDLQEPLRMIASYMQLLSQRYKGQLDEKADKYIHYAVDGAERMKKQITALLEYSRINRGGRTMEPVNCSDIFKQVVINLKEAVKQGGADVTSGDLPTINADAQMLVYIFQNLIGNAVKFRNGKAPHVHVTARRDNNEWLFSVSDNGIGIAPEHKDKIFQIFQRLHSKSEYEGTGIGLALVRKAVEHHKGRIWVESEPGSGATFFFTIPN